MQNSKRVAGSSRVLIEVPGLNSLCKSTCEWFTIVLVLKLKQHRLDN